jgi:hypothetical protein
VILLLTVHQELGIWKSWQVCFDIVLLHTLLCFYVISWLLHVITPRFLNDVSICYCIVKLDNYLCFSIVKSLVSQNLELIGKNLII